MKKIIKNRVYDTSTAKKIGEFSNGLSYSDFDYLRETLYRKVSTHAPHARCEAKYCSFAAMHHQMRRTHINIIL